MITLLPSLFGTEKKCISNKAAVILHLSNLPNLHGSADAENANGNVLKETLSRVNTLNMSKTSHDYS